MIELKKFTEEDLGLIITYKIQNEFGVKLCANILTFIFGASYIFKSWSKLMDWKSLNYTLLFLVFLYFSFRLLAYLINFFTFFRFHRDVRKGFKKSIVGKVIHYDQEEKCVRIKERNEGDCYLYLAGCSSLNFDWDTNEHSIYFEPIKYFEFQFLPKSRIVLQVNEVV